MPLNLAAHKAFEDLVATVAARAFTLLRHQQFDLGAHADAIFGRAPTDRSRWTTLSPTTSSGWCRSSTAAKPRRSPFPAR
jgi:hypothetical protein